MGKITFILGGARSGKSKQAQKIAKGLGKRIALIATCQPKDLEMKKRIALHKGQRPSCWQTFEKPLPSVSLIKKIGLRFDVIIIDCLTLLIANLFLNGIKEARIAGQINKILNQLKKSKVNGIIVSNEVGLGIVPENKLARDFRDIAGRINQIVTKEANQVIFMVSGIPWKIK